jgi:hypothetical protein
MKLKKLNILLIVFVAVFSYSCGKESSCIKNTGTKTSEVRSISSTINKIKIEDNIDLVITQDSIVSLIIEGGENLLPYIKTNLNGSTLEISNDNKCNFLRSYKEKITVYLSVSNITYIDYTGKGNISSTNTLAFPEFTIETKNGTGSVNLSLKSNNISILSHTGATDFKLSGVTSNLYAYTGSNSWMFLSNLTANTVHVNTNGTGDVIVKPVNTLLVELSSLGNIIYNGNPVVNVSSHTGSGKIIKQ